MSGTVLVLGGRSEIGIAVAQRLVKHGATTVILAARRANDLPPIAGATVHHVEFDADDLAGHEAFLNDVVQQHGPLDTVVVAFGILGDQARAEKDAAHAVQIVHTDYVAHVSILTHLANMLRTNGQLIVFSSVAGVRVRRANYVYGSAKAGLDGFASGLADSGVRLLLVRPGFVIGRMTQGMSPAPFASTPDQVADATVAALRKGKGEVWVPGILRPVFVLMRFLPRPIWRRLPR